MQKSQSCIWPLTSTCYTGRTIKCVMLPERGLLYCVIKVSPDTSLCMSISYSSHMLCGAIAQRIRFGILDFFFWKWGGLISFVPQALSGMGWLHTENVHAQHACDHNRFSSTPEGREKKTRNINMQFASTLKTLQTHPACAYLHVCLQTCVRAHYKLVYL